jgi:hypothetical protein
LFSLYLDENALDRGLALALRGAGFDVLTASEANVRQQTDERQLAYASASGAQSIRMTPGTSAGSIENGEHQANITRASSSSATNSRR